MVATAFSPTYNMFRPWEKEISSALRSSSADPNSFPCHSSSSWGNTREHRHKFDFDNVEVQLRHYHPQTRDATHNHDTHMRRHSDTWCPSEHHHHRSVHDSTTHRGPFHRRNDDMVYELECRAPEISSAVFDMRTWHHPSKQQRSRDPHMHAHTCGVLYCTEGCYRNFNAGGRGESAHLQPFHTEHQHQHHTPLDYTAPRATCTSHVRRASAPPESFPYAPVSTISQKLQKLSVDQWPRSCDQRESPPFPQRSHSSPDPLETFNLYSPISAPSILGTNEQPSTFMMQMAEPQWPMPTPTTTTTTTTTTTPSPESQARQIDIEDTAPPPRAYHRRNSDTSGSTTTSARASAAANQNAENSVSTGDASVGGGSTRSKRPHGLAGKPGNHSKKGETKAHFIEFVKQHRFLDHYIHGDQRVYRLVPSIRRIQRQGADSLHSLFNAHQRAMSMPARPRETISSSTAQTWFKRFFPDTLMPVVTNGTRHFRLGGQLGSESV